jgi:hypothetical protein
MGQWYDPFIVIAVLGVAVFLFYKALKEPIDLFWEFLKRIFGSVAEGVANKTVVAKEVITYN